MKAKLSNFMVESIEKGQKDVRVWDTRTPGFGVKVTPQGKRVYFLFYRTKHGQQRWPTIGVHGAINCDKAREIAQDWLHCVAKGGDPSADKVAARHAPTLTDLKRRYMEEHANVRKKAASASNDKILWRRHVFPILGANKPVAAVTRADIMALMAKMKAHPVNANNTRSLLSKAFNLAEVWGWRDQNSNPCRHVPKFPPIKRRRRLTPDELTRLAAVLDKSERESEFETNVVGLIRLLLFTGARLREIMHAQWSWIDWHHGLIQLPDSKTGEKAIVLSQAAMAVIMHLPRKKGCPFLFPGRRKGKPLVNPNGPWELIRERAGIKDVRLHDLRRTFGSTAAGGGIGLPVIGALMGHTQASTTQGYIEFVVDPLREAADATADKLAAWMAAAGTERRAAE